jgi:hypothetical protein
MKRRFFLFILVVVLAFIFVSCTGTVTYNQSMAIDRFLSWLTSNGYPTPSATPMLGLLLGQVSTGDVISSHSPISGAGSRASDPIEQSGWLFYVDEQPGGFYDHPGCIVVIGTSGGILYTEVTTGWPTVNGTRPSVIDSPTSDSFFNAIVWNPWAWCKPITVSKSWVASAISLRVKGAVVVNGLTSGENLYSDVVGIHGQFLSDMQAMYGSEYVYSVASANVVANPSQRIANAVNYLVNTKGCTNITLYIIGHGWYDSVGVGGYSYTPALLRSLISEYSSVKFAVILETCHAGSWIDNFDGTSGTQLENLGIFIATTGSDQGAYPDWDQATTSGGTVLYDFDHSDSYIEWSSDFLKQLSSWTTGNNWTTVQNYATANSIETEWALYYYCFWKVKGSPAVPPAAGFSAGGTTYTMAERSGVAIQSPQVYKKW